MPDVPEPPPSPPPPGPFNWRRFVPTNWQSIVSTLAIILATSALNKLSFSDKPLPVPDVPTPVFQGEMGWLEPTNEERQEALQRPNIFHFADTEANTIGADEIGDKDGNVFLWKLAAKGFGSNVPTLNQGGVGSCVGHGWATGVNYVVAIQAALKRGPPIRGDVVIAPEVIYGGSRVNANGMRPQLFGDGSNGSWAARFCTTDGCAARGVYGPYDITKYSETQCRAFGRTGIKNELLAECRKNIIGSAALVRTLDELKKSLAQGYPVAICSSVGFAGQAKRDADGFLQERGVWMHCMCILGYWKEKDAYFVMNSWGETWVGGPTGAGEPPPGGFWIKATTAEKIVRQGDSYGISNVKGFKKQQLTPADWTRNNLAPNHHPIERMFANGTLVLAP